jgi:D-tyrosyl-tRNA(Tyr) deacylase
VRAVIQRVKKASVSVHGKETGSIGQGVVVLLGVKTDDAEKDADFLADKIANLRIFDDSDGKLNLSGLDVKAEFLVVSQFTLYGDCRKGRRPSYIDAAQPEKAESLYKYFLEKLKQYVIKVETGIFQAEMLVSLDNDGPVTLIVDSPALSAGKNSMEGESAE